ncbi:sulfurtransferase [Metabacillus litoralis]|uniref:3-mercaptopyruvate sulfurtransferase n=1 Tax=Metabacillus litoralis TaxID=152268 RepID=A0A179SLZ9_9BACI|nr:sulfurtransferase [Metabacillus litoralis]OAS82727.1 3-mercaptopyruvate sulfurtransferase [Metabacillus litoralis]
MQHIVSSEWLAGEIERNNKNLVIVDTRFNLSNPEEGYKQYLEGHLPGAVYVDLEKHLSEPIDKHGGRHPLPQVDKLAKKLGDLGISNDSHVVIYDDQGGMNASRLWWLLNYIGVSNAVVLDGGFKKWTIENNSVTAVVPNPSPKTLLPQLNNEWKWVDHFEVQKKLNQTDTILIDSRENPRYLGEFEPIDAVAGHIPGAKNYFWKDVLNKEGSWKEIEELITNFSDIPLNKEIIVYCGSGVSACPNILALKEAGYSNVKLYAGSWSDWISYPDNPIAVGEEKVGDK